MDPNDLPSLTKKHRHKSIQALKNWFDALGSDTSTGVIGNASLPDNHPSRQNIQQQQTPTIPSRAGSFALSPSRNSTSTGDGETDSSRLVHRSSAISRDTTRQRGVIMATSVADTFLGTAATHTSADRGREKLPPFIIHPLDWRYRLWWYTTVCVAAITSILEPYVIAFTAPGLYPYDSATSILEFICIALIVIDIVVSFNVSRYVNGEIITSRKKLAQNYCKLIFWVDLLSVIPFDEISLAIAGLNGPHYVKNPVLAQYLSLFKLVRMLRMYRLKWFFSYLTYNLASPLLIVTIIRNVYLTFFLANFWACLWYFEARQSNFAQDTWVGAQIFPETPDSSAAWYIYSLYFSMVTLATVGYGDIHAFNDIEAGLLIFWILFLFFFTAYIIGSITLLVVKSDERIGRYRDQMQALQHYSALHELSPQLRESMQRHLKLHFNNQQSSDEAVLAAYPSIIRRQVLRFLYLPVLQESYLFSGVKPRFMDALLAVARVELYLPHVEILSAGDFVNELFIVASGEVLIGDASSPPKEQSSSATTTATTTTTTAVRTNNPPNDVFVVNIAGDSSLRGGSLYHTATTVSAGIGSVIGEVAFFTGTAQTDSITTTTTVRVLAISKSSYEQIASTFASSARDVLMRLQRHTEDLAFDAFPGGKGMELFEQAMARNVEMGNAAALADSTGGDATWRLPRGQARALNLSNRQEAAIGTLLRVQHVVSQAVAKHDQDRATEWLYVAARGDTTALKEMIDQGLDVNTVDYDGRSAMMLAAARGHTEILQLLMRNSGDVNATDAFGNTPLWEAIKAGHDECAEALLLGEAKLGKDGVDSASLMCRLVYEGDLKLLRRLLMAQVDVNVGDYDLRTPLHIAASEGNLPAVELLIVEGNADAMVHDRWGQTPLDEARRVGASAVKLFLEEKVQEVREERRRGG